jgi:UDP-N-acetylmuramoyl-L-alanyl-D-glutamate--2,6-diaminopimelate ligase
MERRLSAFLDKDRAARAGLLEQRVVPGVTAADGAMSAAADGAMSAAAAADGAMSAATAADGMMSAATAADPLITGLEYDSRKIQPGNLYFALPGLHADGRRFIPEAVQRGAAAVIHQDPLEGSPLPTLYIRAKDSRFAMSAAADGFYGSPSQSLAVIGVTGTEGKSTTVYLIYQLLGLLGKKAGFISTVMYDDGSGEQANPEHQTTPEAPAIHRLLRTLRDRGGEYAVVEASSHGLSPRTNRLGDVAFDAGVMTNVTREHLEFHGTWEQYRDDKANLFRALSREGRLKTLAGNGFGDGPHSSGLHGGGPVRLPSFGVVNGDDPSAAFFREAAPCPVYRFSARGEEAELSLRGRDSSAGGNRCQVLVRGKRGAGKVLEITDRLPGAFNAGNVLAALLTLSALLDRPVEELAPLVPRLKPVRGRMTAIRKGQPFEVLVDYAHTPSSFNAIFPPLRERLDQSRGRIISLFGSAGERDTAKRPEQGRIASQWSDILILSDEDPRGEDPLALLREIAAGCPERQTGEDLFLIPPRGEAVRRAFSLARPGDLVLLLGKGHENSIIYREFTQPYDEIQEAEQALAELGYGV